jgi:hypothetical protein
MENKVDLGDSILEWILLVEGEGRKLSELSPYEIEEIEKREYFKKLSDFQYARKKALSMKWPKSYKGVPLNMEDND